MKRILVFSSLCVGLTACGFIERPAAVAPDFEPPERWAQAQAGAEQLGARWWESFGDEILSRLVEEALTNNRDLRGAAARVRAAAAQARIAGADRLPSLEAAGSGSRQRRNFVGFPDFGTLGGGSGSTGGGSVFSTISNQFGVSLDVSWELDLWGRLAASHRAARSELAAAEADFAGARLSLAAQTAKAWFACVEARRQFELAEATAESYSATAERVGERYRRGVRPAVDLRLARSELASARAQVSERRRVLDASLRQLEILLGRYPSAALASGAELPQVGAHVPAGLPADLIARRPDLLAAALRVTAADDRLAASRLALLPRIRLTGSSGTSSEELGDLLDGDFSVWSLAANLAQPIFQGGRLRAGVDRSRAQRDEALAGYVGTALRAYGEVETLLAAEQWLEAREKQLATAAAESESAAELAGSRYEAGLGDYIGVLVAERALFAASSQQIRARQAQLANRVDLYLALGGGFDPTVVRADPAPAIRVVESKLGDNPS